MPGILPMKVIKVGSNAPARIAQACDRCRSKKIRCDGFRPCCSQCATVGFECKTSDKLSRRAFPRGYTESLEERVRALETEVHELKDLLDAKDEKIDVLTKIRSGSHSRRGSDQSVDASSNAKAAVQQHSSPPTVTFHHSSSLTPGPGHDPYFVGGSSSRSIADSLKRKIVESGQPCPPLNLDKVFNVANPTGTQMAASNDAWKPPPRLVTDQMVNVFFQEWAPLFPVLHRPSFLSVYEAYVAGPERVPGQAAQVQLNLVFGIAGLSKRSRINHDTSIIETHWLCVLDTFIRQNTLANLQCCILAQIFCLQTGDFARLNYYRSQSVGMALRLGLHQSQKRFSLSTLTCETRKKVFWTLYALDCFAATVLGLPTLFDDRSIHCEYPIDIDDEYISEQGVQPALPGDTTKLSSALQMFKAVRVMSHALSRLYPASATQEVPLQNITELDQELDQWLGDLPAHLRMEFTNDKPAIQTVSSRSPILALTYHFIRSLIHRPAACSAESDQSSSSMLVLASSSKSIIQILQLLEERNLSFSMCLNKNELLTLCGCGLLLQTLGLSKDSVLMKDYQRVTCTVVEMLQRRGAPGEAEFRRLACSLISVRRDSMASPQSQGLGASPGYSPGSTGRSPSESTEHREVAMREEHGPRKSSTPAIISTRSPPHSTRRFRPIAPSTQRHHSRDQSAMASSTTPSLSDACSSKDSRSSASSSNANLNLDFFAFPGDADQKPKPRVEPLPQEPPQEWDHLFESIAGEGSHVQDSPQDQPDWPSFSDLLSPLQESASAAAGGSSIAPGDQKLLDASLGGAEPGRSSSAAKPQSLLSFSGESMTSAEDLGQYDWISPEHDGVFAAAVDMPGAFATDDAASAQHESPQAVA